MADLNRRDIYARMVNSTGKQFHSPAMCVVREEMLERQLTVIPDGRAPPRSDKWISTSGGIGGRNSADYQVNNACGPVWFYEATRKIQENAVVLELSPHALFTGILHNSLDRSCTVIGMMRRAPSEGEMLYFLKVKFISSYCSKKLE